MLLGLIGFSTSASRVPSSGTNGSAPLEVANADGKRIVVAFNMRFVLASLLVLCAVSASAQSTQSPTPQNPQHTQNKNQIRKTPGDKEIAKEPQPAVPVEINVSANYDQDSDRNKGSHNGIAKDISDFFLAIFTLALVVVGVLQWLVLPNTKRGCRKMLKWSRE